ncbi:ankyrin repeat protein [Xylaria sp. FL0043]|nr:ankyrin repeat protein [Xylaria sp. FL0043]
MADEPPPLPIPSSQFISHLSNYPQIATRELLQPYLRYEAWLRKEFARGDAGLDNLANMVSIYDACEAMFTIRTIDRAKADDKKYLMPLSEDLREQEGDLAITTSLKDYQRNFDGFSHDWSNIIVAGLSALFPLLPRRKDVDILDGPHSERSPETYFYDIDVFFYGLDSEDEAIRRISEIEAVVILRLYKSVSKILTGFDVDCACVAFDGKQVYSNPRGVTAIATRTNTVDLSRRSPSYENRLWKYRNHYFEVFWDSLDRLRINIKFPPFVYNLRRPQGLARLLFSEQLIEKREEEWRLRWRRNYWKIRSLKKIDDKGEPSLSAPSGYATYNIPYTKLATAKSVRDYVTRHAKEPCLFGTIQEVMAGEKPGEKRKVDLADKVTFIKDDPGRQMIGSFQPLSEDDW